MTSVASSTVTPPTALNNWQRITAAIASGAPVPGSVRDLEGGATVSYYRDDPAAVDAAASPGSARTTAPARPPLQRPFPRLLTASPST